MRLDELTLGALVWWRVRGRHGRPPQLYEGRIVYIGELPHKWRLFPKRLPRLGWHGTGDRKAITAARRRTTFNVGNGVIVQLTKRGDDELKPDRPVFSAPYPQHLQPTEGNDA